MSKKPAAALSANLVAVKGTATPASDMPGRAIVAAPALAVVPTDATSKPQRAAAGQGEVGDPMCQAKRGVSVGLQRRARCAWTIAACRDGEPGLRDIAHRLRGWAALRVRWAMGRSCVTSLTSAPMDKESCSRDITHALGRHDDLLFAQFVGVTC